MLTGGERVKLDGRCADGYFVARPPPGDAPTRESVELQVAQYMLRESRDHGTPCPSIARHMLGLRHGLPGARRWRQVWSDHRLRDTNPLEVVRIAHRERSIGADRALLRSFVAG